MRFASEITRSPASPPFVRVTQFFSNPLDVLVTPNGTAERRLKALLGSPPDP
jgi:hypothetical protein